MSNYLKSILLFGYLPTSLLLVGVLAGTYYFHTSLEEKKQSKKTAYENYQKNVKELELLEDFLGKDQHREKMKFLGSHLDEDLLQTLSRNLAEILAKYDEEDIHNTEIGQPTSASPIASQTESSFSRVNLGFEGHFSAIQESITELEFRMPQLSLESLTISTNIAGTGSGKLPSLRVKVNYLCWHRPEAS